MRGINREKSGERAGHFVGGLKHILHQRREVGLIDVNVEIEGGAGFRLCEVEVGVPLDAALVGASHDVGEAELVGHPVHVAGDLVEVDLPPGEGAASDLEAHVGGP